MAALGVWETGEGLVMVKRSEGEESGRRWCQQVPVGLLRMGHFLWQAGEPWKVFEQRSDSF